MITEAINRPSPNFGDRARGTRIDILLLHYTGMLTTEGAIDRLCDAQAGVSAHYLIDEAGTVYAMVAEEARAWHAGEAAWGGVRDINSHSIGIELINPGHEYGYRDFPDAQIDALIPLARDIMGRFGIPPARVLAHSDVAPARKQDPGERFPWALLSGNGVGLFPPDGIHADAYAPDANAFLAGLGRLGYPTEEPGNDADTLITAFRRHFRPDHLAGPLDGIDGARLGWLLDTMAEG
jgi:N-acetylmuramoyl-L-alanine amidase